MKHLIINSKNLLQIMNYLKPFVNTKGFYSTERKLVASHMFVESTKDGLCFRVMDGADEVNAMVVQHETIELAIPYGFIPFKEVHKSLKGLKEDIVLEWEGEKGDECPGIFRMKTLNGVTEYNVPDYKNLLWDIQLRDDSVEQWRVWDDKDMFVEAFESTLPFVAPGENARYGTTIGVLWDFFEHDVVKFAATDGKRLSVYSGTMLDKGSTPLLNTYTKVDDKGKEVQHSLKPVVNIRCMENVLKILKHLDFISEFEVSIKDPWFFMYIHGALKSSWFTFYVSSRLIEGRFPNYPLVIPKDNDINIRFDRKELMGILKTIKDTSTKEDNGCEFYFENDRARITYKNTDCNKQWNVLAFFKSSMPFTLRIDPEYMYQVLELYEGKDVVEFSIKLDKIEVKDKETGGTKIVTKPTVQKPILFERDVWTHVLVPLTVAN